MEITFRRLLPTDVAQYRALRLECLRDFPNHFGSTFAEEAAKPVLRMEAMIGSGSEEAFVVGAFDGEVLIGICGISRDPAGKRRHAADVIQMYVRESYSGRKVGLGLIQAAMAEAWKIPELNQLVLSVMTCAQPAARVYAQAGFEQFGFHKDYVQVGDRYEDALMMILFRNRG
jgi:RimJ/RimL family protein N-acetyltransferase